MKTSAAVARIMARTPLATKVAVSKVFDVAEAVNEALTQANRSPEWLAEQVGIETVELAGWLGGMHPLTLDEVAKMEAALQQDLLVTPGKPQGYFGSAATVQKMAGFNAQTTTIAPITVFATQSDSASKQNFLKVSVQTADGERQRYYPFAA